MLNVRLGVNGCAGDDDRRTISIDANVCAIWASYQAVDHLEIGLIGTLQSSIGNVITLGNQLPAPLISVSHAAR